MDHNSESHIPFVSVIVTVYNQCNFINHTIASIHNQTFKDLECIIIDDGSTDDSAQMIEDWCKKDSRIKYIKKANGGVCSARNLGMKLANGRFIHFLDGDDWIDTRKLKDSYDKIKTDQSDIVFTDYYYSKMGKYVPPISRLKLENLNYLSYLTDFTITFVTPIHSALIAKILLSDFRFDETISHSEDWLMWLHIFKKKPKCSVINKEYAAYNLHHNNATNDSQLADKQALDIRIKVFNQAETEEAKAMIFRAIIEHYCKRYELILDSNTYKLGVKIRNLIQKIPFVDKLRQLVK